MKAVELVKASWALFVVALCMAVGHAQTARRPVRDAPSSIENLLAEGEDDLTAGHYEEAASRFRAVLARRSDVPEALFGLGMASSQLGQFQAAREALARYVRLRPSAADGHCAFGVVLLADGRRAGAKVELERALRLEPQNIEAAKALAHIATAEYNGARAVALLKPLTMSPDFDDEARRLIAAGYEQSKDDKAALSTLGAMLDRQPPPPPEVFVVLVRSAMRSGDLAIAKRTCDQGLRLYLNSDEIEERCLGVESMSTIDGLESTLHGTAEDVPTLILMGRLLAEITEVTDDPTRRRCIKLLEKAVALNPADSTALYNLGRALRMMARLEEAVPVLQRALNACTSDELQTLIWTQIGLAEQKLQQNAKAEDAFSWAFQINRRLSRHFAASGFSFYTFLIATDKEQQAAAILDEILKWDPAFVPARMKRARMMLKAHRLLEAVEEADFVARNTDPQNRPLLRAAHLLLLQLYTRLGRTDEAKHEKAWLSESATAKES